MVWRGTLRGLVVVAVAAAASRPASAQGSDRPAVVLKSGARVEARAVTRSGSTFVLTLGDGRLVSYSVDDVDLDASQGALPPPSAPARGGPEAAGRARSLGDYARAVRLELPDAGAAQGVEVPSRGRLASTGGAAAPEPPDGAPATDQEVDQATLAEVQTDIHAVTSAWGDFQHCVADAQFECGSEIMVRRDGGTLFLISGHETAYCRDVIERARRQLPGLEEAYSRLLERARRAGLEPGRLRELLRQAGLERFPEQLETARISLDGWHSHLGG